MTLRLFWSSGFRVGCALKIFSASRFKLESAAVEVDRQFEALMRSALTTFSGLVARQCLGTRRIAALAHLAAETRAWTRRANRTHTCIRWRFTRKDARTKFGYKNKLSTRSET